MLLGDGCNCMRHTKDLDSGGIRRLSLSYMKSHGGSFSSSGVLQ